MLTHLSSTVSLRCVSFRFCVLFHVLHPVCAPSFLTPVSPFVVFPRAFPTFSEGGIFSVIRIYYVSSTSWLNNEIILQTCTREMCIGVWLKTTITSRCLNIRVKIRHDMSWVYVMPSICGVQSLPVICSIIEYSDVFIAVQGRMVHANF